MNFRLLCTGLIPFVYLASLNISICSTIRKSSQLQMPNSKSSCRYTLCLHGSHEDSPEYPASNTDTSLTSTPSIDNRGHKMTSMKSRSSLHPPPTIRKSSNNSSKCMKQPAKLNVNKNCSSSSKNSGIENENVLNRMLYVIKSVKLIMFIWKPTLAISKVTNAYRSASR